MHNIYIYRYRRTDHMNSWFDNSGGWPFLMPVRGVRLGNLGRRSSGAILAYPDAIRFGVDFRMDFWMHFGDFGLTFGSKGGGPWGG